MTFKTTIATATLTTMMICVGAAQPQEKKIEATVVKYDGLKQEILKHRGKVVLVDFWATWCPACMQAFPKFVDKHKKYADRGLVVISVSLDKAADPEAVARANKFLTRNEASFRNLLLDEPGELWDAKMGIKSLPAYFVFDRQGKWTRFRADDNKDAGVDYETLEKVVVQMLNEK